MKKAATIILFTWILPNLFLARALGLMARTKKERAYYGWEYDAKPRGLGGVLWKMRISAFTLGDSVFYGVVPDDAIRAHESRHVQQYRVLGPFFLPVYFLLLLMFGYKDHPLERDAREYEYRICGRRFGSRLCG
jgi:hypothetical protein